jgi:hypothetical protein
MREVAPAQVMILGFIGFCLGIGVAFAVIVYIVEHPELRWPRR